MADLAALQRAFHDACTGAAPLASARELVREDGVDPVRRLHVYANAYWTRIAGALAEDFPKLRACLGAEAFDALVIPYLRAYPTRHPSLREAGLHLARFLDERDPVHADLARLERARTEVFDGPDAAPMSRDDAAALPPAEFPRLALRLVPASALLELSTNADALWDAIEDERPPPPAVAAPRAVLVWRRDLTVIHRTLEPDEAAAVRRVHGGASFEEVCEALAAAAEVDVDPTGLRPAPRAEPAGSPPPLAPLVERALELLLRWLDAGAIARDSTPRGTIAP